MVIKAYLRSLRTGKAGMWNMKWKVKTNSLNILWFNVLSYTDVVTQ